jgi:hypothetical protein
MGRLFAVIFTVVLVEGFDIVNGPVALVTQALLSRIVVGDMDDTF